MTTPVGTISFNDFENEVYRVTNVASPINDPNYRKLVSMPDGWNASNPIAGASASAQNTKISFSDLRGKTRWTDRGTYISQYCSNFDLRYIEADGNYYSIDVLGESNSATCGYRPYQLVAQASVWTGSGDQPDNSYLAYIVEYLNTSDSGYFQGPGWYVTLTYTLGYGAQTSQFNTGRAGQVLYFNPLSPNTTVTGTILNQGNNGGQGSTMHWMAGPWTGVFDGTNISITGYPGSRGYPPDAGYNYSLHRNEEDWRLICNGGAWPYSGNRTWTFRVV